MTGADLHVVFVSEYARQRAAVERALPRCAPLSVTAVSSAAAALDALAERDVDCVAVEHAVSADETADTDSDGTEETADTDSDDTEETPDTDSHDADADTAAGTDALHVLRLVRDADPAVPVVVFEAGDAASVASDAISLDVTEYVREREAEDALAVLARACHDAATTYRTQQDVAMLNDLARSVYERVTDGFFALDRDWTFTYVNDAAEDILDVDADDVVGEHVWDAFPDAVGRDFYTEFHRAMATQEPVTFREQFPPLETTFELRAFPSEDGLSVHFREVDGDAPGGGDHLLELTDLLSSDLLDSIEAVERDLEAARETVDAEEIDDALDGVERMRSLVNYSIRLANEPPQPDVPSGE